MSSTKRYGFQKRNVLYSKEQFTEKKWLLLKSIASTVKEEWLPQKVVASSKENACAKRKGLHIKKLVSRKNDFLLKKKASIKRSVFLEKE